MNDTSLKAKIRNIARQKKLPAQVVLQNYLFERFMFRLSKIEYKDKFVVKGGTLISSVLGLSNRATMDLDTTLKNLPLTKENIKEAVINICSIRINDGIDFEFKGIEPIRDDDVYGGFCVSFVANLGKIKAPLSMDVSTGDIMTPDAELRRFSMMFEDDGFFLWSYNIETILGEKIETILSRGIFSTRPRDFYDVYAIVAALPYDKKILKTALIATAGHRGSLDKIKNTEAILKDISESLELKRLWKNYQSQFPYASTINYDDVIELLRKIVPSVLV
ncbi:nucleotidyl transferase AbiEii/AbiGii toxin family protein [Propionispira raffinosivorans]|uniref:nucleotidyl transferase AbiEii/AbiGii toxin family protein n=1 Tax=Propionispira raffinosivorans TaxID=86959 RepID=UPI00036E0132|nr:nucleotidyl transferase AbiEii/AbiGii toxin family protein [Propionispira raffinosivorans]